MTGILKPWGYEIRALLDLGVAIGGVICSLAFACGVAKDWLRWKLFLGAGIILFTLAYFGWDSYVVHVVH